MRKLLIILLFLTFGSASAQETGFSVSAGYGIGSNYQFKDAYTVAATTWIRTMFWFLGGAQEDLLTNDRFGPMTLGLKMHRG